MMMRKATEVGCFDDGRLGNLRHGGFTLVEIMIVVAIIGVLNMIAIPAFRQARVSSTATQIANDFRVYSDAFTMQAADSGKWCPDSYPGGFPSQMEGYIRVQRFKATTSIGGRWDWDGPGSYWVRIGNYEAALAMYGVRGTSEDVLKKVDDVLDDGNLGTGRMQLRYRNLLTYTLESFEKKKKGGGAKK